MKTTGVSFLEYTMSPSRIQQRARVPEDVRQGDTTWAYGRHSDDETSVFRRARCIYWRRVALPG